MEADRILESARTIRSNNTNGFKSVGGHLAQRFGLSESNPVELTARVYPSTSRQFAATKRDFLPFVNERDRMNRLLTVLSEK